LPPYRHSEVLTNSTAECGARTSPISLYMGRHPPRSTLFPYTTLFRSNDATSVRTSPHASNSRSFMRPSASVSFCADIGPYCAAGDRKSTRLNSKSRFDLVCRLLLEKKKSVYGIRHKGIMTINTEDLVG